MTDFKPGDRVYVTDPGLEMLREVMRRTTGQDPPPNHHGTVHEIWEDGYLEIWFDNTDGEGQGQSAPYPPDEVRHLQATKKACPLRSLNRRRRKVSEVVEVGEVCGLA